MSFNNVTIAQGDCLELMQEIKDESISLILCDLPYGVLNRRNKAAQWDKIIPIEPLWEQYKRILKQDGVIALFGSGMFTAKLMTSNPKMWRYNLIWKKGNSVTGFLDANRKPLRNHEDICIFTKQGKSTYNPQFTYGEKNHHRGGVTLYNKAVTAIIRTFAKHRKLTKNILCRLSTFQKKNRPCTIRHRSPLLCLNG